MSMDKQKKIYIVYSFACILLIACICVGVFYSYVFPKRVNVQTVADGTELLTWHCDGITNASPGTISINIYQGIRFTLSGEGRKGYTVVHAWAYMPEHSIQAAGSRILIKNETTGTFFELHTESEIRADVTAAYGEGTFNYDLSGLIAYCPNWFLNKSDEYRFYIFYNNDEYEYLVDMQLTLN